MAVDLLGQLAKEFKRAGKKSLVLAALFAVGLFIWLPMLWRSVFGKPQSEAKSPGPVTVGRVEPRPEPVAASPTALQDWKILYRRVERSDLVQPVVLDELVRDPFDRSWIHEKGQPVAAPTNADDSGDPGRSLVLSATLAGSPGGAAVISDRVYRIGDEVPAGAPVRYLLKQIRADSVTLERAGVQFELRLKELDQAAKDTGELIQ